MTITKDGDWTKEELRFCLDCLSKSETVEAAYELFWRKYPNRTANAIRKKLTRLDLGSPTENLRSHVKGIDHKDIGLETHLTKLKEQRKQYLVEQAEEREMKALRNKNAIIDLLIERVEAEIYRLPKDAAPKLKLPPIKTGRHAEELVAVVSDVQIGEKVQAEEVAGCGEYSFEIFKNRVEVWTNFLIKLIKHKRETANLERIHIPFIGDIVEGVDIFSSQAFHLDVGLLKQTVQGAYVFAQALAEVAKAAGDIPIEVYHVGGNHGRIGKKGSVPYHDNWDRMVGFLMQLHLEKYPTIKMAIPEAWFFLREIYGWLFHFSHGDDIQSWMSIPAYGMMRAHARETIMLGAPIHYYVIGHHHVLSQMQNGHGEVICNGNWVGANEFSAKQIKSMSRPSQIIFSVNKEYGIGERHVCYFESREIFQARQEKFLKRNGL